MNVFEDNYRIMAHWVSTQEYARRCRIQHRAARTRLRQRVISGFEVDGVFIVDVGLSPPTHRMPRKKVIAPQVVWPADMPSKNSLVRVSIWCEKNGLRSDAIFRSILNGHRNAWAIGDHVFIENDSELLAYRASCTKRKRF